MASTATTKEMGRASYIWIKHEEERRKASWKEPEARVFSATTRTDVAALLGEPRDQILVGRASFADLAAQQSGCWGVKRTPVHALFWWISLRSGVVR
ncbi:peptidyl-prolyl cis-trans isomerase Pin1-like [Triticum urartu]|uniref:peptidyl-prolyl cis-trans isomerase Pin1-like n=1 Tax=Triticum urartu TaxID=4572 RepID=UPI002044B830|nr:peptidyl-prolyl cis-trans isomerase Pin1-like [Triticum urartu]XP_048563788.1 peptidyl-prolyl cis-trans isomerase Pin1-like [Triticum urartu]XP_048563789.1 peptidyl-prolyl cis-trans isomerase Pin1-like [Triticum urartu]XP_048563790.1 peptidyl-prolyl cis-trans isomerase Pin1-like [Triticum urartu]